MKVYSPDNYALIEVVEPAEMAEFITWFKQMAVIAIGKCDYDKCEKFLIAARELSEVLEAANAKGQTKD